jgi:hypothetical protein
LGNRWRCRSSGECRPSRIGDVRFGSKATLRRRVRHVGFYSESGLCDRSGTIRLGAPTSRLMQRRIIRPEFVAPVRRAWWEREVWRVAADNGAKGPSVILVLNQYNCIGCSPGKHPDTRTMATASDGGSRDSVHDRCACIAVWRSERLPKHQRRDRHRAH